MKPKAPKSIHDRAEAIDTADAETADFMDQALQREFHLVAPEEMIGLRVEDIRQLHLFRLRERVSEQKSVEPPPPRSHVDPVARAIELLDGYRELRGKAAMAMLRDLDPGLFPKHKSADAAALHDDNFWRRIKYERSRRKL
jgi:hypothetical protein